MTDEQRAKEFEEGAGAMKKEVVDMLNRFSGQNSINAQVFIYAANKVEELPVDERFLRHTGEERTRNQ